MLLHKDNSSILHRLKNKLIDKFFVHTKLIDTSITLRTKYLCRELKSFFNLNVILSIIALLSAILTAITTFTQLNSDNKSNSSGSTNTIFLNLASENWLLYLLSAITIILSIIAFVSVLKTSNPAKFINKIIEDQYDIEEFTAIFIIKMVFDNVPKILVFRSETWNSYFLPYCHYDSENVGNTQFKYELKVPLSEVLEINENDFDIFDDFSRKDYITIKRNPSHETTSKINYKFFYVKFNNPYVTQKFLSTRNKYFSWKSKYELANDLDTQKSNGDVLKIIDELSLLNQSKLAFKEPSLGMFDIKSRFRIIWNITNECYFECPICATNSGKNCSCSLSEEKKLKILLNLSSISGFIDELDFSGGDPLKNQIDRNIIKKANQLFPYTQISVTTTGAALEELSVDELVQTVKTCDITYDMPYNVCSDELKSYREYQYNYSNFKQLERFSNSGIKIALNIHIPILPVTTDREFIKTIFEDLSKINPVQIKFIRLMPVGRMNNIPNDYSPEEFLKYAKEIIEEKQYKFKLSYNCSLGVKVNNFNQRNTTCRNCEMLSSKLGIDAEGYVYSCIWGAYIPEFVNRPKENPFFLGDLKKDTLYDILTNSNTIKLAKDLKSKNTGCRVCAYLNSDTTSKDYKTRMLTSVDPLPEIHNDLI